MALSFIFPFLVSAKAVDTQTEHEAEGISTLRSVRSSIGNDGMIPLSMDVVGIKFVVETYLAECVENMFLWKENDISCHTLDGIALRYQTNDLDTLRIDQKEFLEYRSKNETALMAASNRDNGTNIDSLYDNLALQEARVEYFKHLNKILDITYDYFDIYYFFDNITSNGEYAIVSVSEKLNYKYTFCDEPTYEEYMYDISLTKVDGAWIILEIVADDPFYWENYKVGFNLDAAIYDLDLVYGSTNNAENSGQDSVSNNENANDLAPTATGDITYLKQNAINYALTFSTQADDGTSGKPKYTNPNMPWFSANCMNFVSQCIWAGFGGSNSPEDIKNCHSMDTEGTSAHKWYAVNVNNYSSSWAGTKSFKSYVDNPVAGEQDMNCLTKEIASTSNNLYFASSSLAGSAVLVRGFDANNNPAPLGHVVFINDAKGNTRDKLYMTSYNTNWKNKVFESRYPMLSYASDLDKLYVVVPVSMKNANPGFRLWGSLCNAMPSGASVPISGYASETCTTIAADIYNPAGNLVATRSENNCASIYFNYNFSQGGTWKVVLKGVDSSGHIAQFTYVIRIY